MPPEDCSVSLCGAHDRELFPSLADLKAAAPSFLLPLQPTFLWYPIKSLSGICVCEQSHMLCKSSPFSSLPVSSCFLSALSLILSVWSTSWFPRHVQINRVETLLCYTPGCHTGGKARPGNPFRGIWMIRRSWPGWEWRHCSTETTRCGVRADDGGVSKLQVTHMPSNLIK